jgi:hypothetical protein
VLDPSPNIIGMIRPREIRWVGLATGMEKTRNSYRALVEKPEETTTFGRPTCRREDNNKTDLK